jgi:NAD(P)H dehydrogenase (quinone)
MGLPKMVVEAIIDADTNALKGDLDSSSRELSTLIGRPTTTLTEAVQAALPLWQLMRGDGRQAFLN